ncbi:MAG: pilus assembly protein TadG-related protein [Chloroflexi bacterium]|nr:pilus assembly protein TadG-related protein [Chloroflexota bacterium]
MNFKHRTERGQALVLIVLGIVGLIAITTLAIDAGNAFLDRRHAQNAADTAAFAAVLEKIQDMPLNGVVCGTTACSNTDDNHDGLIWSTAGLARARTNGYNNDVVPNTVTLYNPPVVGDCNPNDSPSPYVGNWDYIQVIIRSTVKTYFAPIIGIKQLNNCVEAIAHAKPGVPEPMVLGNLMAGLSRSGTAVSVGGGANITLIGGGTFSNSSDSSALTMSNNSSLVIKDTATSTNPSTTIGLSAVGGILANPLPYPSPITTGDAQYPNPLPAYMLPNYTCNFSYVNFPPTSTDTNVQIAGKVVTFIKSGVYCVSGSFNSNQDLSANSEVRITIVLETAGISWTGQSSVNLTSLPRDNPRIVPPTYPTGGLLFYLPPSNTSSINLAGGAGMNTTGSILAPGADIKLAGNFTGSTFDCQFIGNTVSMSGSLTGTFRYTEQNNYAFPYPGIIELTK